MSWQRAAVLVMAGGSGLRLWPLSRRDHPKPLLSLPRSTDPSMLRQTALRLQAQVPWARTFVNVTRGIETKVLSQLPELPKGHLISAADDRDTLPTVLHAGAQIERVLGEDPLLVLMASDNHIGDAAALATAIERGLHAAAQGHIVSIGVRPSRAATEYGYMECGEQLAPDTFRGVGYHEKPDAARAAEYLAAGHFDWNSGLFVIPWSALRRATAALQPRAHAVLEQLRALPNWDDARARDPIFAQFETRSIDHGIFEQLARTDVPSTFVRAHVQWDDLGSFDALARFHEPLGAQAERVELHDCYNMETFVSAPYRLTARGLDDLLIAVGDNGDVLIAPRGTAARLRALQQQPIEVTAHGSLRKLNAERVQLDAPKRTLVACVDVNDLQISVQNQQISVTRAPHIICCEDELCFDEKLAQVVADEIAAALAEQPTARVILSAGATPLRAYELLTQRHRALDWARVELWQMDEWIGARYEDSFERFLRHHLVEPLGIGRFVPIDANADDAALQRAEQALDRLDFVLHGIGSNAHIGFNEPGTPHDAAARRVQLAPSTAKIASHGVTLGFRSLDRAKRVVVAAKGAAKREAIRRSFFAQPSLDAPASRLQNHRQLKLVLDREALP